MITLAASTTAAQSRVDRAYVSETLLGGSARGSSTELGVGTPPLPLVGPLSIGVAVYGRRTWLRGGDPHGSAPPGGGSQDGNPQGGGTFTGSDAQLSLLLLAQLSERWTLTVVPVVAGRFTGDADFRMPRVISPSRVSRSRATPSAATATSW